MVAHLQKKKEGYHYDRRKLPVPIYSVVPLRKDMFLFSSVAGENVNDR